MSSERKPKDMTCPLYIMAHIIAGKPWEDTDVACDGDDCALWSKGSGLKRCGLRNV